MVNNVWDIVNEDRLRPSRPTGHLFGSKDVEDVEAATKEAEKYDAYMTDFIKAACLLVESISDQQLSQMKQRYGGSSGAVEEAAAKVCSQIGNGQILCPEIASFLRSHRD